MRNVNKTPAFLSLCVHVMHSARETTHMMYITPSTHTSHSLALPTNIDSRLVLFETYNFQRIIMNQRTFFSYYNQLFEYFFFFRSKNGSSIRKYRLSILFQHSKNIALLSWISTINARQLLKIYLLHFVCCAERQCQKPFFSIRFHSNSEFFF